MVTFQALKHVAFSSKSEEFVASKSLRWVISLWTKNNHMLELLCISKNIDFCEEANVLG